MGLYTTAQDVAAAASANNFSPSCWDKLDLQSSYASTSHRQAAAGDDGGEAGEGGSARDRKI